MLRLHVGRFLGLTLMVAELGGIGCAGTSSKPQEAAPPAKNETAPPAKNETAPPAKNETAPPAKNEYVSSATCASCHEELSTKFARNPHQILETDAKKG